MSGREQTDLQRMQEFTRMNNELVTLQRELAQKNAVLEAQIAQNEKLQDKLIEVERNKVLIQTAGAAAHEINQPLTVLMGNLQMLSHCQIDGAELREMCQEMYEAAQDINEIVKKMSQVRQVTSKAYIGETTIVDFEGASDSES